MSSLTPVDVRQTDLNCLPTCTSSKAKLTKDRRRKENCGKNKFYFDLTLGVTKKSVVDQLLNEKNKLTFLFFVDFAKTIYCKIYCLCPVMKK